MMISYVYDITDIFAVPILIFALTVGGKLLAIQLT